MRSTPLLLTLAATAALSGPAQAQQPSIRLRFEPTWLNAYGHDQSVLTIHELTIAPPTDRKTAVTLNSQAGPSWIAAVEYSSGGWTFGLDFLWFDTRQQHPGMSQAAGTGADLVRFEVADAVFQSSNLNEVLFYRVLEDTELALWTLDAYAVRTLAGNEGATLGLQFGVRFADFDNDYRAMAGVEGSNGIRFDASSNYGRMTGPLVGLRGTISGDRLDLASSIRQAVVIGEPALEMLSRRFTGPAAAPAFTSEELFSSTQDIAIPITDVQLTVTVNLMDQIALGAGVRASTWWDVAVPPGVIPIPGGDQVLQENTLVFLGLMAILEFRF